MDDIEQVAEGIYIPLSWRDKMRLIAWQEFWAIQALVGLMC
jgi:hypothetical protein